MIKPEIVEVSEVGTPVYGDGLDKEMVIRCLEKFLGTHSKINEGTQGIITLVNPGDIDADMAETLFKGSRTPEKRLALKMMKVYTSAEHVEEEARIQQLANEIIKKYDDNHPEQPIRMGVPEIYFGGQIKLVSEQLKSKLEDEGVFVHADTIGVVLMDCLEGEDLATRLYGEVAKRYKPAEDELHLVDLKHQLAQYSESPLELRGDEYFKTAQAYAHEALHFEQPGGKSSDEWEREFEARKIEQGNFKKLISFLGKNGYVLDAGLLDTLKTMVSLLHENNIYHRDLHERNIMITPNLDGTVKALNIIDFGLAKEARKTETEVYEHHGKQLIPDEYILNAYSGLTEPLAQKEQREFFDKLNRMLRMIKNNKIEAYSLWAKQAKELITRLDAETDEESQEDLLDEIVESVEDFVKKNIADSFSDDFFNLRISLLNELSNWSSNASRLIAKKLAAQSGREKMPVRFNTIKRLLAYRDAADSE